MNKESEFEERAKEALAFVREYLRREDQRSSLIRSLTLHLAWWKERCCELAGVTPTSSLTDTTGFGCDQCLVHETTYKGRYPECVEYGGMFGKCPGEKKWDNNKEAKETP